MSADGDPRPDVPNAGGDAPPAPEAGPGVPVTGQPVTGTGRRALWVFALVASAALLVDLGAKQWAISALTDREPVRLLGGALYLTLIRNSGAAFSLGSDYTWIFPLVTVAVVGWIGWLTRGLRSLPWAVALGLVLGGALGNLLDRVFRAPGPLLGHVVDMFSVFHPYGQVFPIFNVADSALVVGVLLAVLLELTGRQRDGRRLSGKVDR
ncbi:MULTISPECIES: signal peptidase II [unclassified Micromonospora]|uniref:signal peptidase II n=1 Tax=unclassified Micromonospora TaxID=2617518 RepID=UPI003A8A136A